MDAAWRTLRQSGWLVDLKPRPSLALNADFARRYPALPENYIAFLSEVACCNNASETVWFLCENDFNATATEERTFHWNEWERIGLESAKADNNAEWAEFIRRFWDGLLPFLLSVKNGYSFAALSLLPEKYGAVVVGREPEFEEVETVAASFTDFLDRLVQAVSDNDASNLLRDFL